MKRLKISQVDTVFVNGSYPIEMLFFYRNKIKTAAIIKALKYLSPQFWPLFAEYKAGLLYEDSYTEEVFINEIICKEDFNPEADERQLWQKYHTINPEKMSKLFRLSILQFNNGTALIPKMNHLAGDGYSYFYFLSLLAAIARLSKKPLKKAVLRRLGAPHHQRTVLKDFHFNKTKIKSPLEHPDCTLINEAVSKKAVKNYIRKIKADFGETVSTNDILCAVTAKKTIENQRNDFGDQFTLSIPIDVRRNIKELGAKFFGNGIMFHTLNFNLAEHKEINIEETAVRLRRSMPEVNKDSYMNFLQDLEDKSRQSAVHNLMPYNPAEGCLVTNLSRMPVKKLNFGTGDPDYILLLTIGKNSAAVLADKNDYILRSAF